MRLFVAVELPEAVKQAAQRTAHDLATRLDSRIRVRWIAADQMHLTVRFIGQVADDQLPAVLEVLSRPLAIPAFELVLEGCGVFPTSGAPRVFWIGVSKGLDELREMHEEFNARLEPLGFEPEGRTYSAHLTLGRVKDARPGAGRAARETVRGVNTPRLRSSVNEAVVFQSVLSAKGPTYSALRRCQLRPLTADC